MRSGAADPADRQRPPGACSTELSGEIAAAGEALAAVVVDDLFLVLHQQAVELVGKQVDRGVHVDGGGVGVEGAAGDGDGGLGPVIGLVEAELGADVEGLVEVAFQSRQLGFDVVAQAPG